ncbi:adenosylcobinamide-GDP ribazoletransferase [Pelosinus sp. IPA-1]|uniref:adenosylcobinamide-GDP ribazoletransferase n=1 Tax=Pelosinus sp. IPA-1 TaxID=3029569 RepID=UPI002436280B|nr:adenosylcobinamide-GDP ribazoletransferase [Pelosinus sp. IPA-1]GMA97606.1 adenosylcobinamide-GDP ribazoletransferase [Pelosinus sp. IPA-1]
MLENVVEDFLTGLQFLTRISIKTKKQWSLDSFSRSVKFFPIIGGIIGLLLTGIVYGAQNFWGVKLPLHLMAVSIILIEIIITGGLHCDGLMDTVDGVFSGKSRERMLEIMKDSRVGAFGAMSFCLLIVMKYSLILDIEPMMLPIAIFVMPIIGRTAVVVAITLYPYARADGLGKGLSQCEHKNTLYIAGLIAMLLLVPFGKLVLLSSGVAIAFAILVAEYVNKRLGGLTGDVYGAVVELTELVALVVFLF